MVGLCRLTSFGLHCCVVCTAVVCFFFCFTLLRGLFSLLVYTVAWFVLQWFVFSFGLHCCVVCFVFWSTLLRGFYCCDLFSLFGLHCCVVCFVFWSTLLRGLYCCGLFSLLVYTVAWFVLLWFVFSFWYTLLRGLYCCGFFMCYFFFYVLLWFIHMLLHTDIFPPPFCRWRVRKALRKEVSKHIYSVFGSLVYNSA
jgi:hypothetical protein